MEFKDYYEILGVAPDAETTDIKAAYRRLARKYHPDLNPDEAAEANFKEVAEAWEVLRDETRRAEYDELRRYGGRQPGGFEPPPGWRASSGGDFHQFSGDFSEFFNSVFGEGFAEHARSRPVRGNDIEIEMPVFLEETVRDCSKPVRYRVPEVGPGGIRQVEKSLKVTIPAGVVDGERVRLRGQGAPGRGDGPPGDLYLHIRLVPHPLFDVEGRNLSITVPVAPWEAALGARVTVPTLDGKISLTVAPGSQSGQRLRVRGKGLKGKLGTGDLYAVLKVVMPPTVSREAQALWRQLADMADFDPREVWEGAA